MKLGVVSLLRNEADIVVPFLEHLAALFDHAVLMDHGSVDGTAQVLRSACIRPGWACWHVAVPGYHQAAFTGFAAHHLLTMTDVNYVALLDADEFLDVKDRATLEAALAPLAANPRAVPHLPWRNSAPVRPGRRIGMRSILWVAPSVSPHCKVMLPRRLWQATGRRAAPRFGNHDIDPGDDGPIDHVRIAQLLHLPVRSVAQLKLKLVCGTLAMRLGGSASAVAHWAALLDRGAQGGLRAEDMADIVARYGEADAAPDTRSLRARGFVRRRLGSVAHQPVPVRPPDPSDPLDLVAAVLAQWSPQAEAVHLYLRGDVLDERSEADQPPLRLTPPC